MKILITGGTGFIGSHLAESLIKQKFKVRALVRKYENDCRKNLGLLKKLNVEVVYGDLLDINSLKKAVKGIDLIFHLAAIARPMAIPNNLYFKINKEGTRNLLEVCKKNKKIRKIIIMSSVSAVGPTRDGKPVNEKTKCGPVDVYGLSKLAEEKIAEKYIQEYKMPIVILRPPMVFGPRDFEMLRLFRFMNMGFFPIRGNEKCMEFLYVGNLVEACNLAAKYGRAGEKYHITNGQHYSINDIIRTTEKVQAKKILPIVFPKWSISLAGIFLETIGKIFNFYPPFRHDTTAWMTKKFWYSDDSKAKKELKYKPIFSLEEGIRNTINWYEKEGLL